ncbi:hypothetical protein BEH93_27640 [Streptomyces sp. 2R]|nr:hypothetical protein BEH93_27640 [Streptomyces sp. 2R]
MTAIRNLRSKRVAVALISAAAVGVFGVGGALAAGTSDDGPAGPSPVPGETQPAGSSGSDGGSDGGTVSGSGGSGGGTGGPVPSTSPSGPPHTGGPDPSPTDPADLAEVARRIDELEKKVDQLPTKKELADALRAFADSLEQQG